MKHFLLFLLLIANNEAFPQDLTDIWLRSYLTRNLADSVETRISNYEILKSKDIAALKIKEIKSNEYYYHWRNGRLKKRGSTINKYNQNGLIINEQLSNKEEVKRIYDENNYLISLVHLKNGNIEGLTTQENVNDSTILIICMSGADTTKMEYVTETNSLGIKSVKHIITSFKNNNKGDTILYFYDILLSDSGIIFNYSYRYRKGVVNHFKKKDTANKITYTYFENNRDFENDFFYNYMFSNYSYYEHHVKNNHTSFEMIIYDEPISLYGLIYFFEYDSLGRLIKVLRKEDNENYKSINLIYEVGYRGKNRLPAYRIDYAQLTDSECYKVQKYKFKYKFY